MKPPGVNSVSGEGSSDLRTARDVPDSRLRDLDQRDLIARFVVEHFIH